MELKLKELHERHAKAEPKRKREEAQQAKFDDQRRRELTGSVVFEKVQNGEIPEPEFRGLIR